MEPIDLKVRVRKNQSFYDINFQESGDFELVEGFDTSIQMSFFGEVRADPTEMIPPELRRGWWGNELSRVDGYEVGNKLWLLHQARNTQETLNLAVNYVRQGFQWYIDDGLAKRVEVSGERDLENDNINITITIFRSNDEITSEQFQLWNKTTLNDI